MRGFLFWERVMPFGNICEFEDIDACVASLTGEADDLFADIPWPVYVHEDRIIVEAPDGFRSVASKGR